MQSRNESTLAHVDGGKVGTSMGTALTGAKTMSKKAGPVVPQPLGFGKFRPPEGTSFTAMAVKSSVQENLEEIRKYIEERWVAIFNDDPSYYTDEIKAGLEEIVGFIGQFPNSRGRQELSSGVINMMLGKLPASGAAVNTVANLGVKLGVLTPLTWEQVREEEIDRRQFVPVPLSDEDGRWRKTPIMCNYAGARGILAKLRDMQEKASAAHEEQERAQKRALYDEIAGPLLDVLKQGYGYTAFFSPDQGEHRGGTVRISVANGVVEPIMAVGGCAGLIRKVVDSGRSIPLDQIESDGPLRFEPRIPEADHRALSGFRHVLRRGITFARQMRSKEEASKGLEDRATLSPEEFYLEKKEGSCVLTIRPGFRIKKFEKPEGRSEKVVPVEYVMRAGVTILWERTSAGIRIADHTPKGTPWDELLASATEPSLEGENYDGMGGLPKHLLRVFTSAAARKTAAQKVPTDEAAADKKEQAEQEHFQQVFGEGTETT